MRPTQRPDKPYTTQEIMQRVYQHFIVEGNPKCASDPSSPYATCDYGGTGCAVGCLMVEDDASSLDDLLYGSIDAVSRKLAKTYAVYFTESELSLLYNLQEAHDSSTPATLKPRILEVLNANGFTGATP